MDMTRKRTIERNLRVLYPPGTVLGGFYSLFRRLYSVGVISYMFRNLKLKDGENYIRVTGCCNSGKIDYTDHQTTQVKDLITVGTSEFLSDECTFVKVAEADSSYTLPDNGAGQAVKNWFLEEDTVVREEYYAIEDTANDLLDNPKALEIMKKHMPELTKLMMEKDIIPLGLTLKRILSRNPGEIDQKALNEELNKVPVEY